MDKRRIAAMLAAAWVPLPVAARRGAEAVAFGDGTDCCSKDAVGRRPARALLPARELSLRAIPNHSTLPRPAVHAESA
jgi:hypothetical protein